MLLRGIKCKNYVHTQINKREGYIEDRIYHTTRRYILEYNSFHILRRKNMQSVCFNVCSISSLNLTVSIAVYYFIQINRYMFRSYDHLQAKHVAVNLNKIVNSYWNRVALDGNPWTWSNTRNRMQTTKFKILSEVSFALFCFHDHSRN
jgi:hypothetical protein